MNFLFFCFILLSSVGSYGQIIGPSVTEVNFKYTARFQVTQQSKDLTNIELAEHHANHLFGLLHSPTLVQKFDLNPDLVGGIGAPQSAMKIKIKSVIAIENNIIQIEYENKGLMLLHKKVAQGLLKSAGLSLPMPLNLDLIFDEKCTDELYNSIDDYWYFYDIFRTGCKYLAKYPYSENVDIQMSAKLNHQRDQTLKLPQLRGDNDNGDLFSIAIIHGFAADKADVEDPGRVNFNETNDYFLEKGFSMSKIASFTKYPRIIFRKEVQLSNGQLIHVEVQHLLVETSADSSSKVFAQFFKDAVKSADVIIYAGHSGLGGNLDIPTLEKKAGEFVFNKKKKQIFYFDSCASYSYYLKHFSVEKTKAKIDIMTNGLSSYFHTAQKTLSVFLDYLISDKMSDIKWLTVLTNMENKLDGGTYLLNVGGI